MLENVLFRVLNIWTVIDIYTTIKTTSEFRNVSVTVTRRCVGDGNGRGWLGVVSVVDTRLV